MTASAAPDPHDFYVNAHTVIHDDTDAEHADATEVRCVLATFNCGRVDHLPVPAAIELTTATLTHIRDSVPHFARRLTAIFFQEIGEGDRYDEMAIVRKVFTAKLGWRVFALGKEPIVIHGDWVPDGHPRIGQAHPGIPHESPARKVSAAPVKSRSGVKRLGLVGTHYDAGAYNGDRPAEVKRKLIDGWEKVYELHRKAVAGFYDAGWDCATGTDDNRPAGVLSLHRAQEILTRHRIDYVIGVPATGRTVDVIHHGAVPSRIEAMHQCLWADVRFRGVGRAS